MLTVLSLWLPILVSAALIFVASALIHMFLGYHGGDLAPVSNEDATMAALRPIPPGDYIMPHARGMEAMKSPEFVEKRTRGPVVLMTVMPPGPATMGKELTLWFVYCIVVSVFAAYLTSRAVMPGSEFWEVFRFAGTSAFLGYALAHWQESIWFKRKWSTTLKNTLDGLVYALITGAVFGWLWPGVAA